MSTIDRAFVKAFARRQTADVNLSTERIYIPPSTAAAAQTNAAMQATATKPHSRASVPDAGGLKVDRSVADTTAVWIDSDADSSLRSDVGHATARRPVSQPASIDPASDFAKDTAKQAAIDEAVKDESTDHATVHTQYAIASFTADVCTDTATIQQAWVDNLRAIDVAEKPATDAVQSPAPTQLNDDAPQFETETDRGPVGVRALRSDVVKVDAAEAAPVEGEWSGLARPNQPFCAAWEVDAFDLPSTVADLFFSRNVFESVGKRIASTTANGLRTAYITSTRSGEGRSTVAMGIALAAAGAGLSVALVDADLQAPTLVDELRLDLEFGWLEAQRGGLPIDDIAVHATEDGVSLIPLVPSELGQTATADELEHLVKSLRQRFDLVVIDGGVGIGGLPVRTDTIETAMIVRDVRHTNETEIQTLAGQLIQTGIAGIGVIENFCPTA